jgi:glutamate N-acetyltransferase/amino-acid N-acetyltransferase
LRAATQDSFERLDADGCLSTNDTVLFLASGASGVTPDAQEFTHAVDQVCADLANQLIADAEGATKIVRIDVHGAATQTDARDVARAIARSNLLKCALYGNDPNWGRVLAAIGTTDATFAPDHVDVALNGTWVAKSGRKTAERASVDLSGRDITISVTLGAGDATDHVWTTDLTVAYVHENSAYST